MKKENRVLSEKEIELLNAVIEHIRKNVIENGLNIDEALVQGRKFLKKTSTYMEEQGFSIIFEDFIRDIKKSRK